MDWADTKTPSTPSSAPCHIPRPRTAPARSVVPAEDSRSPPSTQQQQPGQAIPHPVPAHVHPTPDARVRPASTESPGNTLSRSAPPGHRAAKLFDLTLIPSIRRGNLLAVLSRDAPDLSRLAAGPRKAPGEIPPRTQCTFRHIRKGRPLLPSCRRIPRGSTSSPPTVASTWTAGAFPVSHRSDHMPVHLLGWGDRPGHKRPKVTARAPTAARCWPASSATGSPRRDRVLAPQHPARGPLRHHLPDAGAVQGVSYRLCK